MNENDVGPLGVRYFKDGGDADLVALSFLKDG